MNQLRLSARLVAAAMLAAASAAASVSCGLPTVPDNQAYLDYEATKAMTLVAECRLTGVGPRLQRPTIGPEPDVVPLFIPLPEAETTKAMLFIPSLMDKSGNKVFQYFEELGFYGDSAALVYGIRLLPDRTDHRIDFASQVNAADSWRFRIGNKSADPIRRFDLSVYQAPGESTSRLMIATSTGDGYSSTRSTVYGIPFPDQPLGDSLPSGGAARTPDSIDLRQWSYTPAADATSSTGPTMSPPGTPLQAVPALSMSQPYSTGGDNLLMAIPGSTGLTVVHNYALSAVPPPVDQLFQLSLQPWSAATPLPAIPATQTPLGATLRSGFNMPYSALAGSFASWSPTVSGGYFVLSTYQPDATSAYKLFGLYLLNGVWTQYGPLPFDQPVVRILSDGTLLTLKNGAWSRASFGLNKRIVSTQDGTTLPTGSLQFLYERTDTAGVSWLYFSQALPTPALPKSDLVLRAWKIKRADLFARAR